MKTIEFMGDPMLQFEEIKNVNNYIFYLNQESMDEINSYSCIVIDNIPEFFSNLDLNHVLFAKGGIDENGDPFPDTFIGIKTMKNAENLYKISGIYASDFCYVAPDSGEEILLKKRNMKKRQC